jgi:hypothetical protein
LETSVAPDMSGGAPDIVRWHTGQSGVPRDGNGYPRPDTRWVFTLLGYVYGLNIVPMGILLGKNIHPMGKWVLERSVVTHTR